AASRAEKSAPIENWARHIEAYADTTAASAFFFASASAVLFNFQPSASNPVHTTTAAPASAPRQKCFVPAGNAGILNSMAPPLKESWRSVAPPSVIQECVSARR